MPVSVQPPGSIRDDFVLPFDGVILGNLFLEILVCSLRWCAGHDLNVRHSPCKRDALPTELPALFSTFQLGVMICSLVSGRNGHATPSCESEADAETPALFMSGWHSSKRPIRIGPTQKYPHLSPRSAAGREPTVASWGP